MKRLSHQLLPITKSQFFWIFEAHFKICCASWYTYWTHDLYHLKPQTYPLTYIHNIEYGPIEKSYVWKKNGNQTCRVVYIQLCFFHQFKTFFCPPFLLISQMFFCPSVLKRVIMFFSDLILISKNLSCIKMTGFLVW